MSIERNGKLERMQSVRFADEDIETLSEEAKLNGCSISEIIRRKVLENPSEGIREAILSTKDTSSLAVDICISVLAHLNVILDIMGLNVDDRQDLVDAYKETFTGKPDVRN